MMLLRRKPLFGKRSILKKKKRQKLVTRTRKSFIRSRSQPIGIARALRIFIEKEASPLYTVSDVSSKSILKMHVKPETSLIRPFVVCAILRGITFDEARYNSFIELQDKLHQNICRRRTLVAIGTHDLDTIQGPFSYEALPPQEINFVPLKQVKSFRADDLLEYYKSDMKLKKFLHIIENSPVYPVIYDNNRTVLSLPPIINGAHSAINLKTRNVFIECTATDLTKAKIVLNTMVTMFSEYCEKKFEVEPVEVIYSDGKSMICPDLSVSRMEVPLSEIIDPIGISLDVSEVVTLLNKMQLEAAHSSLATGDFNIVVSVPPTRSDILHARDVMEDVAIAYGYNNIPKSKPKCMTTGGRQPLNRFSDKVRAEVARAGYMEVLTWVLCSHEENFSMLRRKDDGDKAVIIANPRSADFEVVRTSLMSCLLKTLKHNIDHPRPIKIFEVGDVVVLGGDRDVGASNNRRLAALYCNVSSGFEEILGLVERIMKVVRAPHINAPDNYLKPSDEPEYFPNRQCSIIFNGKQIGNFGIVHPEVLKKFGIPDPCSFMEIDIQSLL
ncbi:phenylalanine--tRNA ligase beta subunit, cytoplasmic-like isoform X2 [Zingiber officinale]|uniref:phenylalanine--tRNA ligase beta subunit, cytoplasmic-like isoform X2 n=1 Tax=Zingiber officinale TaxID=94328 RepID=UPI001C4CC150|nr:phenylalanine--tRNA ligase beta subunit, cytoplasmic-like isoform X2 [Zingiber officinale]